MVLNMADITMCKNKECKLAGYCYRFTATPGMYQSYADFKADGCEYFWPENTKITCDFDMDVNNVCH